MDSAYVLTFTTDFIVTFFTMVGTYRSLTEETNLGVSQTLHPFSTVYNDIVPRLNIPPIARDLEFPVHRLSYPSFHSLCF